jgi:trehalose/maltose hydrolase-like predicted phosphorylase
LSYDRRLNMKSGTLDREILWETHAGKRVLIRSRRLVLVLPTNEKSLLLVPPHLLSRAAK